MTENGYAATATAEKRLREVIEEMVERVDLLNESPSEIIVQTLLEHAEIEYLPRKKSVSIRLVVPEFATKSTSVIDAGAGRNQGHSDVTDAGKPKDLPHDRGAVLGPATVVRFTPLAENDYEDDFFTE